MKKTNNLNNNLNYLKNKQLELNKTNKLFLGLDSGFKILNNIINGFEKEFYLFAASSAMGKTSFLTQLSWNIIFYNNNTECIFFSLDTSSINITAKIVSFLSNISIDYITKPFPPNVIYDKKRLDGIKELHEYIDKLYIYDQNNSDIYIEEIGNYIKQFNEKSNKVIIIDTISKIKTFKKFNTILEKDSYICSYLKEFSRKNNITLIVSYNLPKDAELRRPEKKDLTSDPVFFYDPYCVFSLYCDYINNNNTPFLEWLWENENLSEEEAMVPISELNVLKHKMSNNRERIFFKYKAKTCFFEECSPSENNNYNAMIKNIIDYNEKKVNEEKQFWKNIAEGKQNYIDSAG